MRSLLKYFRGFKRDCLLAPLFKLLEAAFELLVPAVVASIIDVGIAQDDSGFIIRRTALLFGFAVLGVGASITAQYFAARGATGFSAKVSSALFRHVQTLSPAELDQLGASAAVTRLTSDINTLQNGVNMFLRLLLRSPFVVFGAMIAAFTIDAKSALIFVCIIPVLLLIVFAIMLVTLPLYKKSAARLENTVEGFRGQLSGARVQRAFLREKAESERTAAEAELLAKAQRRVGRISALLNPLTWVVVNVGIIILIRTGAIRIEAGLLSRGALVALYNYMSQILVELIKLANLIVLMTRTGASASRISSVMSFGSGMPEGDIAEPPADGSIEMRGVSLTYTEGATPALEKIDVTVPSGSTLGVIGSTGSGKSSFASLILRLYDPTEGEVLVGGRNVRDYKLSALRSEIGYVPQKAVLFEGTVADNLRFGDPDADEARMAAALEAAQAGDFAAPENSVYSGGTNLSGGQRQRLCIARALVKRPKILVFDDSSSALDNLTENRLWKAVAGLPETPTRVIISQKITSVRDCDAILVLEEGVCAGYGTHDELLETSPVYREIFEAQR